MLNIRSLISLALIAGSFVVAACGKKSEEAGGSPAADKVVEKAADKPAAPVADQPVADKPTNEVPPAPAADPAGEAAAPVKVEVKALFAEFGPDAKGDPMALLDKYRGGATFTAKVKQVQPAGDHVAMLLDVDGKNIIQPSFTDEAAIKAKPPKAGDSLTLTCKIAGEVDALMQVTDCVIAK